MRRIYSVIPTLFSMLSIAGCNSIVQTTSTPVTIDLGEPPVLMIYSSEFNQNEPIPQKYTCDGENISPPLKWDLAIPGTESQVLIMDDPDAPMGTWVHWVIFDLPAQVTSLPARVENAASLKSGGSQGINDSRKIGYSGPCPPKGKPHRYFFKIYALDTLLNLIPGKATKADVERAMQGHILAQSQLIGIYSR